jgi:hypothetical protein
MARIAALVLVCGALVLGSALTVAQVGATTPSVVPTTNCGPGPDTVPPQVIALRLNPDKVSVSQHSATVDVVAHAVDTMASQGGQAVPGSGVRQLQISLEGDRYAVEDADLHLSSGSAQNGVWRGRITIGRNEDASTWDVDQVIAVDAAGNSVVYPRMTRSSSRTGSTRSSCLEGADRKPPSGSLRFTCRVWRSTRSASRKSSRCRRD